MTRFTIEEYNALKAAYVKAATTGVYSVAYGDKTVTYHRLEDMRKAMEIMEQELFPERFGRRRKLAQFERGYFKSNNQP